MNKIAYREVMKNEFDGRRKLFEATVMTEHGKATVNAPTLEALIAFVQSIETQQGRGTCELVKE